MVTQYYDMLQSIQDTHTSELTRLPTDEPRFKIDLNSRSIEVPKEFKSIFAMETDHLAETVYFECDRYFDDVDLLRYPIVVEYINADKESRIYPILKKDEKSLEGKLIFGWTLGKEVTKKAGKVQFAIHFYSVNRAKKEFIYSLNTIPVSVTIGKSLGVNIMDQDYSDEDNIPSTDLGEIWAQMSSLGQDIKELQESAVYWNDV